MGEAGFDRGRDINWDQVIDKLTAGL